MGSVCHFGIFPFDGNQYTTKDAYTIQEFYLSLILGKTKCSLAPRCDRRPTGDDRSDPSPTDPSVASLKGFEVSPALTRSRKVFLRGILRISSKKLVY